MSQTQVGRKFWAGLAANVKDKELQRFLLTGNAKQKEEKQRRTDGREDKKGKIIVKVKKEKE